MRGSFGLQGVATPRLRTRPTWSVRLRSRYKACDGKDVSPTPLPGRQPALRAARAPGEDALLHQLLGPCSEPHLRNRRSGEAPRHRAQNRLRNAAARAPEGSSAPRRPEPRRQREGNAVGTLCAARGARLRAPRGASDLRTWSGKGSAHPGPRLRGPHPGPRSPGPHPRVRPCAEPGFGGVAGRKGRKGVAPSSPAAPAGGGPPTGIVPAPSAPRSAPPPARALGSARRPPGPDLPPRPPRARARREEGGPREPPGPPARPPGPPPALGGRTFLPFLPSSSMSPRAVPAARPAQGAPRPRDRYMLARAPRPPQPRSGAARPPPCAVSARGRQGPSAPRTLHFRAQGSAPPPARPAPSPSGGGMVPALLVAAGARLSRPFPAPSPPIAPRGRGSNFSFWIPPPFLRQPTSRPASRPGRPTSGRRGGRAGPAGRAGLTGREGGAWGRRGPREGRGPLGATGSEGGTWRGGA